MKRVRAIVAATIVTLLCLFIVAAFIGIFVAYTAMWADVWHKPWAWGLLVWVAIFGVAGLVMWAIGTLSEWR